MKKDMLRDGDVPLGLGMVLAQNAKALDAFAMLTDQQKQSFIRGAENVNSRVEMQTYVNRIAGPGF
jgi:hypothetical protein